LLYLYSKREQSDLSDEDKKLLSSLVEVLKKSGKGKK